MRYRFQAGVSFFRTLRLGHAEIKTDICILQMHKNSQKCAKCLIIIFKKTNYETNDFCIKMC
jgi:hypothetical protein